MKRIFIPLIMLLFLSFLWSCEKDDEVKIGFSLGPSHERWQKDIDYFSTRINSAGGILLVAEAENDHEVQVEQVRNLIKKNIDVLVIVPIDSEKAAEIVELAHDNNISVIAYDRIIKNSDLDFYISFDNMRVGEMQAEYLSKVKPEGNYAVLGGDPGDHNSLLLRLGQMNVLQPLIEKGSISLVLDTYITDWSSSRAEKIIDNYLQDNPEGLDAIVASNDNIATGAFNALVKHGLDGKVLLSGQDAEVEACQRIVRGDQTMTVYKYIETLAVTAASTAMSIAKGDKIMNTEISINNNKVMVPAILLPSMITINSENMRMTVIADGYMNEQMIFGNNQK
jgi:D-xylose transport system substrate-binding protein